MADTPKIDNLPVRSHRHGQLTVEGWSRAGIQTYWRIPELRVGFDLGGIPWEWTPTGNWFISHAHLDHLLALPAFLARRWMMKYPPPTIHVPFEIVEGVRQLLAAWQAIDRGKLECNLVGVAPGDRIELSKDHYVTAFPTAHPVPSRGYVVWERRQKLRDEFVGLPADRLRELRESGSGLAVEVPVPLVCYTGDTGPAGLDADPAVYTARILIAELSFLRTEHSRDRIHAFGHLHLDDFLERADRFQNELVVVGHVTSRDDPADLRRLIDERAPSNLGERIVVWQ